MSHVSLPCDSCGDPVTAHADYLTPVTLCGSCTPEQWDGATLPTRVTRRDPDNEWTDFSLALLDETCGPLIDDDVTEGMEAA